MRKYLEATPEKANAVLAALREFNARDIVLTTGTYKGWEALKNMSTRFDVLYVQALSLVPGKEKGDIVKAKAGIYNFNSCLREIGRILGLKKPSFDPKNFTGFIETAHISLTDSSGLIAKIAQAGVNAPGISSADVRTDFEAVKSAFFETVGRALKEQNLEPLPRPVPTVDNPRARVMHLTDLQALKA